MKKILNILLVFISICCYGQSGITFQVEKLSKPEDLLQYYSYEDICKSLIREHVGISSWDIEDGNFELKYNIIAKNDSPDSLINYGYNSFFIGMNEAYANHRPFVLSPDMIWLLISQGFAQHINANANSLAPFFVNHSDKIELTIETDINLLENSSECENIFPQITEKISKHTGQELIKTLTSDFSTTTATEKIASEITIMEAMKSYFEFVVIYAICGIPEITLLGTTEDWEKILTKTKNLSKYELDWWVNELEPLLKEFINASKGKINKKFWKNMFKSKSKGRCADPVIFDGWIVKFFPYDKDGKRNDLKKLVGNIGGNNLPDEIVIVDIKYIETDYETYRIERNLELWSGFFGLEQNPDNFALTPKIGWLIRQSDDDQKSQLQKLKYRNTPRSYSYGIKLSVDVVPENLKNFKDIYHLDLSFIGNDVYIPEWLKDIRIGKFYINGKISQSEKDKIINWFPNTDLTINGTKYNTGNNGWIKIYDNTFPTEIFELDKIWILEFSFGTDYNSLIIPNELANIDIEIIVFGDSRTPETIIEKFKKLAPKSTIYVNEDIVY